MPRGILGSLLIAVTLFIVVSLVLVGMFDYAQYKNNAEPVGWALRMSGHSTVAVIVQAVSVIGMFTALIGMMMAGSRLLYSFGRDGILPSWLGKLDKKFTKSCINYTIDCCNYYWLCFSIWLLAQLISAGALVAFMFVTVGIFHCVKEKVMTYQNQHLNCHFTQ